MNKPEIRGVINQCGIRIELLNHLPETITIGIIRPSRLEQYRDELAENNPDMRYATIGQIAGMFMKQWADGLKIPGIVVSPGLWQYNASEDCYYR